MNGLAHAHQPAGRAPARVETAARRARTQPSGPSNQVVQTKLRVGAVDDPLEREADRVADALISGAAPVPLSDAPAAPQRKCAACAANEEKMIRRKCEECEAEESETVRRAADGAPVAAGGAEAAAAAVATGGAPLAPDARAYFEPRFGRDLSDVRVHTDGVAARAADQIGARAYTLGAHIAFASGEFAPATSGGSRLLAHELAHVGQQRSTTIRRTLNPVTSNCPANVHNAPSNPLGDLDDHDRRAQHIALGGSHLMLFEALARDDALLGGPGAVSTAYRQRFGHPPAAARGRFRDRFSNRTHATENAAIREEMIAISRRLERLHGFLAGSIRYRCPGTAAFTVGNCARSTCGGFGAVSCADQSRRQMMICPHFWDFGTDARAGLIVHEAVHMAFHVRPHRSTTAEQRGRNPACFESLLADIYGFPPADQQCPALP